MTNPSDTFHTFYSREYLSGPTLMIRELEFLAASEHVTLEGSAANGVEVIS